jgi:hypothetical protein
MVWAAVTTDGRLATAALPPILPRQGGQVAGRDSHPVLGRDRAAMAILLGAPAMGLMAGLARNSAGSGII